MMLALPYTKRLAIESNANFMYDFALIVETNTDDPIISIAVEANGNNLDSYTLANWPTLAPKRVDNSLIYKLDFWFSNESTPLHATSANHMFIRVTSTNDYPMTLTNSGKSCGELNAKYVVNTHAEIKVNPNYLYPIELLHVIGTFTIYCKDYIDKILCVITSNYTYDISANKTKYLTLPVNNALDSMHVNKYVVKVIFVNARHDISISYYQYNAVLNTNQLAMKYSTQVAYKTCN